MRNKTQISASIRIRLLVEEGNGKPLLLICTSQVCYGTSEMTMLSWTCLRGENSSSSSQLHHHGANLLTFYGTNTNLSVSIGNRDIVAYGWNGNPSYIDRAEFP